MPHIEAIDIYNFRNHDRAQFVFKRGVNVIWGENGSGKTAVLEAVYTLSMGRSFRTHNHKETLKENTDSLSLKGLFNAGSNTKEIRLNQLSSGQRKFFVNDAVLKKTKDLIGENPIVLLSPEEQRLTKGTPGDRRNYFNKVFSTVSQEYLNMLIVYQRILKQRNSALQEVRRGRTHEKAVEVWNEQTVSVGTKLWKLKTTIIEKFIHEINKINAKYNKEGSDIVLRFVPEGDIETFEERLKKALKLDLVKGWTTVGPHRDDYRFLFNERLLKKYGSQGEHKLALVLIKMAEINIIKTNTGKNPILMLDDFFAKLDFQRADSLLSLLNGDYQTIITTTDIVDFEKHGINLNSKNNATFHLERKCKV